MIRILLSKAASDALDAAGADAFVLVAKVKRTEEPEANGRFAIHLAPADFPTARGACAVLLGTHRAVAIKRKTPSI